MNRKITSEVLLENGFTHSPNIIQDSYSLILEDINEDDSFIPDHKFISYRSLTASLCNDKGEGEYYLFLREGSSENRMEDDVVGLTRNLQYEDDLKDFLRLLNLNS